MARDWRRVYSPVHVTLERYVRVCHEFFHDGQKQTSLLPRSCRHHPVFFNDAVVGNHPAIRLLPDKCQEQGIITTYLISRLLVVSGFPNIYPDLGVLQLIFWPDATL
jgi:hypothetical protein